MTRRYLRSAKWIRVHVASAQGLWACGVGSIVCTVAGRSLQYLVCNKVTTQHHLSESFLSLFLCLSVCLSRVSTMDTYSFQDSLAIHAPLLGACDWCETTGKQGGRRYREHKLKKCGGCSEVMYCSKNCQTAAWPTHKCVTCSTGMHFEETLIDRKSTRLNSSHSGESRMPSSA